VSFNFLSLSLSYFFSFLVIAAMKLDDGSMKMFLYLLKCGILEIICGTSQSLLSHLPSSENSVGYQSDEGSIASLSELPVTTLTNTTEKASRNKSKRQESMNPASQGIRSSQQLIPAGGSSSDKSTNIILEVPMILKMQELYYNHLSLLAWAIRLGNIKICSYLLKKFSIYYHYHSASLEEQEQRQHHYPLLHYLSVYGNAEMIDAVLSVINSVNNQFDSSSSEIPHPPPGLVIEKKKIFLRYEYHNKQNETPFMLASKHSNFSVIKKYYQLKVNLRNALHGKYSGWVLAFVKRLESKEVLTQTGRYEKDDEMYFNLQNNNYCKEFPIYTIWQNK
jgi:hypothetical protein